jgi:hypothetical protein
MTDDTRSLPSFLPSFVKLKLKLERERDDGDEDINTTEKEMNVD